MATSFGTFMAKEYKGISDGMKEVYGSLERFKELYVANRGLTPWLETLRDHSASEGLVNDIAKTYIKVCNRTPGEIPSILASISRTYNMEIPAVEGILTKDYWQQKATDFFWINNRTDQESISAGAGMKKSDVLKVSHIDPDWHQAFEKNLDTVTLLGYAREARDRLRLVGLSLGMEDKLMAMLADASMETNPVNILRYLMTDILEIQAEYLRSRMGFEVER